MQPLGALRRPWRHVRAFKLLVRQVSSVETNKSDKIPHKSERDAHIKGLEKYYPPSLVQSILTSEAMVSPDMWRNRKASKVNFAPIYSEDFALRDPFYDLPADNDEWRDKSQPRQPVPRYKPPGLGQEMETYLGRDNTGINLTQLSQLTGYTYKFLRELRMCYLHRHRVCNMTRKGKQSKLYALVAVGDGRGHVGLGEGKHPSSMAQAAETARWNATRNLVYIPRFENRTIYGSISSKFHAVLLNLRPGAPGSGLRVNHVISDICRLAGIRDLAGNVYRSRNPMNVAKAALEALSDHQNISEDVAMKRGKKIVDVTKTYYKF